MVHTYIITITNDSLTVNSEIGSHVACGDNASAQPVTIPQAISFPWSINSNICYIHNTTAMSLCMYINRTAIMGLWQVCNHSLQTFILHILHNIVECSSIERCGGLYIAVWEFMGSTFQFNTFTNQ